MLRTKMYKSEFNQAEYAEMANWCNSQQYKTINDMGDYYEVVDCTPTQEELNANKKQQLEKEISKINSQLAQLQGISVCAVSVDGVNQYDVFKDGVLVVMNETEFQNYFDELSDKRSDLLTQYKELK